MRGRTPVSFAVIACCAKTWVSPIASRRRSAFDRLRTYPWKRRSATTAAISPLTTMPSRKSAGNRKRSELNILLYKVLGAPTGNVWRLLARVHTAPVSLAWCTQPRNSPASPAGALGLDRIPRRPDLVADAPHGHDRRRLAELPPQLAHVDVHGSRIPGEGVAPDAF